jgi:integrase
MLERTNMEPVVERVDGSAREPEVARGLSGADTDGRLVGLWLHGKSEATKEAYRSDLAKFADFTEGKPLRTITLADVQDFADFISELLAPASRARILAALKSLFAFGHQVGYLPFDVGRPVKLPSRRDERSERILSADDVHSMVAHAKKGRDRALIRTLYIGGLRVTEAVSLRTRSLVARDDGRGGQLGVFGKGAKTRPVLVPEGLFAELSAIALPLPEEGSRWRVQANHGAPSGKDRQSHGASGRPDERLRGVSALAEARPRQPRDGSRGEDTPRAGHAWTLRHLHHGPLPARPARRLIGTLPRLVRSAAPPPPVTRVGATPNTQ